ncbi:Helicase SWR1 [Grifola frondosa]|uniref:DNA helicase n=1 Tax=Grifola frondosa TaxID=5627 RepID=A0A1C7LXY1_GRIFR|nr:Helicase SWR1 [Grifola frondosa]
MSSWAVLPGMEEYTADTVGAGDRKRLRAESSVAGKERGGVAVSGSLAGNTVSANGSRSSAANGRVESGIAGGSGSSRRRKSGMSGRKEAPIMSEGRLEDERAKWVQQRQTELDNVFGRHDSLVREAFHMEQFVTLLSYDPKVAKEDKSAVFQEYQSKYDLVDRSTEAGPSRRTRRAHIERLQSLKSSSFAAPTTPKVKKLKKPINESPEIIHQDAVTDSRFKEKDKAVNANGSIGAHVASLRKDKGKGKASAQATSRPSHVAPSVATAGDLSDARRYKHRVEDAAGSLANGIPLFSPRKKRKVEPPASRMESISGSRQAIRLETAADVSISESISATHTRRSSRRTPSVKRVKLIVRRPPPILSRPDQRLPQSQYGGSLGALLSSATFQDVDSQGLERTITERAAFFYRVDALRRQGRLQGDPSSQAGELPPGDVWSHVVREVEARAKAQTSCDLQMAANVASKVRVYWDGQAAREDKVKMQEEKRLRALARATMKMVITEWKKAVFHIREQERREREAEERRRGHEHLDAILDQSGQILEAQQLDLSRAEFALSRSGSSNPSIITSRHLTSLSPGFDYSDSSEVEERSDEDEQGSSESNAEDGDLTILLGNTDIPRYAEESIASSAEPSIPEDLATPGPNDEFEMHSESAVSGEDILGGPRVNSPSPFPDHINSQYAMDINMTLDKPHRSASNSSSHSLLSPSSNSFYVPESAGVVAEFVENITLEYPDTPVDEDASESAGPVSLHSSGGSAMDLDCSSDVDRVGTETVAVVTKAAVYAESQHELDASQQTSTRSASPAPTVVEQSVTEIVGGEKSFATDAMDIAPSSVPAERQEENENATQDGAVEDDVEEHDSIPLYLRPYAVAPIDWDPQAKVKAPLLLRGTLRPYQQAGLEWLASIHASNLNGILADEMGLGKTIQTIALLAHLACDRGIWGPHLIIVPTSVLLNWEMEFKKRRKELRHGWNDKYHFNVCVTSYALASRDAHVFKRKPWYYMILDEAHMIKNFKSQRWNILLMFRSFRRLLLTGTPLQNNLTELWALLQFLMSGTNFANLKEFGEWFANPLEKAIEMGTIDEETQQRVSKLHTVLRPYLLRRLKRDVEKELPQKFEHLVMCPLSKRQRFLYDEFMARADTRHDLQSGVYQKIANILMQLRKVVNHPNLFEVRPIVTSFAMDRSAIADYEIKELLIRRRLLTVHDEHCLNLDLLGLRFSHRQDTPLIAASETRRLDGTPYLPMITELPGEPPPADMRSIDGYRRYRAFQQRADTIAKFTHLGYLNRLRCSHMPIYSTELLAVATQFYQPLRPRSALDGGTQYLSTPERARSMIKSYSARTEDMAEIIDRFAFVTPSVVARDLPSIAFSGLETRISKALPDRDFDAVLHRISVKLQIAFPDPSLLQYDCGKLQELAKLLRERKAGGHRILIFTQMTRILDILEIFLNFHGYLYLRLDGATKIEDRQYITERFNADARVFCFISSSRSGGVGINLTGADTVIFYDSDFNPQMDRQCEDRAHRIGQIRDVHIYRQSKRSLDDMVIQKGEFDWRTLFSDETALTKALGEFEDTEDARAAAIAASEEVAMEGADEADFGWEGGAENGNVNIPIEDKGGPAEDESQLDTLVPQEAIDMEEEQVVDEDEADEGGTTVDYMLSFIRYDIDFFNDWRL